MAQNSSHKRGTGGKPPLEALTKQVTKPVFTPKNAPHEVRIIGGLYKRSKLAVVSAQGLRPTSSRAREALFNWLGSLEGWHCVDMFAGTGALGIEAASRGASAVLLIENNAPAALALEQSLTRLKATACELRKSDAFMALRSLPAASTDLIFVDPPFESQLHTRAAAAAKHALKPDGLLYLEAPDEATIDAQLALGYTLFKRARAGAVSFALLINTSTPQP